MDEITLRKLILKGEDSTLEFKSKRKLADVEDLAAEYVAFLNKRGGILLIGVEDDGPINGLEPSEIECCNRVLRSMAKDKIRPSVMLDTENVPTDSGIVVVVTIEEGIDKPYQTARNGAFYVRSGDEKRRVENRDELRRLFQVGSHVYAEKQVLPDTRLDQLDLGSYRDFFEDTHGTAAKGDDDEIIDQMRALHLVIGDRLTLAGCLLFAKKPQTIVPQFSIKASWIKGTDLSGAEFEDDRQFEGSIPEIYKQAYGFLDAWNQRRQPEDGTYNVKGEAKVPQEVFEEILTNALIHRDYFVPDNVKIFIFDDRIEIYSPGTLPNSLTVEEAVLAGITRKRNPIIEQIALTLMDYKGHGSGLPRVKRLCPPIRFSNDEARNAFVVTIPV
jgi:ATP-dependent DNA helicase RecG